MSLREQFTGSRAGRVLLAGIVIRVAALVDETRFLAEATAIELQQVPPGGFADVLRRREESAAARYRGASYAVVPAQRMCGPASASLTPAVTRPIVAGPWAHLDAP